jgi:hypothetical protein
MTSGYGTNAVGQKPFPSMLGRIDWDNGPLVVGEMPIGPAIRHLHEGEERAPLLGEQGSDVARCHDLGHKQRQMNSGQPIEIDEMDRRVVLLRVGHCALVLEGELQCGPNELSPGM